MRKFNKRGPRSLAAEVAAVGCEINEMILKLDVLVHTQADWETVPSVHVKEVKDNLDRIMSLSRLLAERFKLPFNNEEGALNA